MSVITLSSVNVVPVGDKKQVSVYNAKTECYETYLVDANKADEFINSRAELIKDTDKKRARVVKVCTAIGAILGAIPATFSKELSKETFAFGTLGALFTGAIGFFVGQLLTEGANCIEAENAMTQQFINGNK